MSLTLLFLLAVGRSGASQPHWLQADDSRLHLNGPRLLLLGQPFAGVLYQPASATRVGRLTLYQAGLRDGVAVTWYADGRIAAVRHYHQDRKQGTHLGWWPNGAARFVYHFEQGQSHGSQRTYFENGSPATAYHFDQGREDGTQQAWSNQGELVANYVVRHGRRYGLLGAKPCYTNSAIESAARQP